MELHILQVNCLLPVAASLCLKQYLAAAAQAAAAQAAARCSEIRRQTTVTLMLADSMPAHKQLSERWMCGGKDGLRSLHQFVASPWMTDTTVTHTHQGCKVDRHTASAPTLSFKPSLHSGIPDKYVRILRTPVTWTQAQHEVTAAAARYNVI